MPQLLKADPCQKFACDIQTCLAKNNYQEAKCAYELRKLVECCTKWKGESFKVCQGIEYEGKKSTN